MLQSLNETLEQHYRDILCDPHQREELAGFIYAAECQNHLHLFDNIQLWKKACEEEKPDVVRHIIDKYLDSRSFPHVQIDDKLLNTIMEEQDVQEALLEVEKICIKKMMSCDPKYNPTYSPRMVSPRQVLTRCDTPIPGKDKDSFVRKLKNRLSWRATKV
jgi:hypothetical protein